MPDEIPPPSKPPSIPVGKGWYYAGPIAIDLTALVCTTILVAIGRVPVEDFKYLVGLLVVGNVALRIPGNKIVPPGGGGLIVALASGAFQIMKGLKS